jgi:hypothetical protein
MAARPGQPAGSSYGPEDPRSDRERLADLHTIHEQVCTINSRLYDSAVRDDLIRLLQERREEQADDLLQVDPAPDPRGARCSWCGTSCSSELKHWRITSG